MTGYVIEPPPVPSVAVAGTDRRFPVRRIFCVGRNYAAHAREMGRDPNREPPFFFLKPADAVANHDASVPYPPQTADLHHEIELVVAIGRGGADIVPEQALAHVYGYAAGLDLTRRDLQAAAKELGRPWDWGKGFDGSAPIGPLRTVADVGHPQAGRIWLSVNGMMKQLGDLSEMIWSVPEIIAAASCSMRLAPGDLFMTGTPAGVGAVKRGDVLSGGVDGVGRVEITLA